jgi:hypothetical protein
LRSDLAAFVGEIARRPRGYIEALAELLDREGKAGERVFTPSDNLSLMFYTPLEFLTPVEFALAEPEWMIPSAWLEFDPASKARMIALLHGGDYERFEVPAALGLWQNNPDILYHAFAPREGARTLYHRR